MDHPRAPAISSHLPLNFISTSTPGSTKAKITGAESDIYIFTAKKSPQKDFYNGLEIVFICFLVRHQAFNLGKTAFRESHRWPPSEKPALEILSGKGG